MKSGGFSKMLYTRGGGIRGFLQFIAYAKMFPDMRSLFEAISKVYQRHSTGKFTVEVNKRVQKSFI